MQVGRASRSGSVIRTAERPSISPGELLANICGPSRVWLVRHLPERFAGQALAASLCGNLKAQALAAHWSC